MNSVAYKDPARQREYQRLWRAARRAEWFAGKTCVDCGTAESLDLDHEDRSTKVSHKVWSWSRVRREIELAKCVARCESCHAEKTRLRLEHVRGESHPGTSLTWSLVQEIRSLYETRAVSQRELAARFLVTQSTIGRIVRGEVWARPW